MVVRQGAVESLDVVCAVHPSGSQPDPTSIGGDTSSQSEQLRAPATRRKTNLYEKIQRRSVVRVLVTLEDARVEGLCE